MNNNEDRETWESDRKYWKNGNEAEKKEDETKPCFSFSEWEYDEITLLKRATAVRGKIVPSWKNLQNQVYQQAKLRELRLYVFISLFIFAKWLGEFSLIGKIRSSTAKIGKWKVYCDIFSVLEQQVSTSSPEESLRYVPAVKQEWEARWHISPHPIGF